MKKGLLGFLKKENGAGGSESSPANRKEGSALQNEFAKTVNLEERFEDMFGNENPDEVTYYDIHGNEVEQ